MSMTFNEILESGLLELYVLNQLTDEQLKEVESALVKFPKLKEHIQEIENTLYKYDKVLGVKPPDNVLNKILSEVECNPTPLTQNSRNNKGQFFLTVLLVLILLLASIYLITRINDLSQSIQNNAESIQECDDEKDRLSAELALLNELLQYQTDRIKVSPTEKYPQTELIIHSNPESQKNYLQVKNLPPLADNESFQLWSLKGDSAPIPLDVFEKDIDKIIEIAFEENTNAYAITIEPRGGQDSPTLENLIGVFNMGS